MPDSTNSTPRQRLPVGLVIAIALAAGAGWLIHNVRSGVQQAYAKWGLAEIIIAYRIPWLAYVLLLIALATGCRF